MLTLCICPHPQIQPTLVDNRLVFSTKKKKKKKDFTPVSGPAEFKSVLLKDQLHYEPTTPTSKPSTSAPQGLDQKSKSLHTIFKPSTTQFLSHRHPKLPRVVAKVPVPKHARQLLPPDFVHVHTCSLPCRTRPTVPACLILKPSSSLSHPHP